MKKLVIPFVLLGSSIVQAGSYDSYGRVVESIPVYQDRWVTESIPVNTCEYRTRGGSGSGNNVGRILIGGLIGSAVGNHISGADGMGTLGALVGGAIASDSEHSYQEKVCRTRYETREHRVSSLSHYNVKVTHRGRLVTVESQQRYPIGSRIFIDSTSKRFSNRFH